ncbi:TonB protein [Agrobacterium tumefaciens]|nr:TonB protein [Agrobacterium tumefaciens]
MSENGYPQARHSRLGEVTLWSAAAVLMLSVHAGFAYYLMQEPEELDAGGPPPAAIMIEMAAIPEAVNTEETTQAQDVEDAEEVKSDSSEPVEEAAPKSRRHRSRWRKRRRQSPCSHRNRRSRRSSNRRKFPSRWSRSIPFRNR